MIIKVLFSTLWAMLVLTSSGFSQNSKMVTEYVNVPGPIAFANDTYHLAWSAHPSYTFFKQEYLTVGDRPEHFKTMLLLDVIASPVKLSEVVRAKVNELQRLKQTNPLVNYQVYEKNGEYLLDFLLSQSSPDGKQPLIIEHNLYRYKSVVDDSGHRAVLLFGVSRRGYDQEVTSFLARLKANRPAFIRQISEFRLPPIKLDRSNC